MFVSKQFFVTVITATDMYSNCSSLSTQLLIFVVDFHFGRGEVSVENVYAYCDENWYGICAKQSSAIKSQAFHENKVKVIYAVGLSTLLPKYIVLSVIKFCYVTMSISEVEYFYTDNFLLIITLANLASSLKNTSYSKILLYISTQYYTCS